MQHCKPSAVLRIRSPILTVFLALLLLIPVQGLRSHAAEIFFYPSWEEYKAAGEPAETWNDAANAIDSCLEASYAFYVQETRKTPILRA